MNAGSDYTERRAECDAARNRLEVASLRDADLTQAAALPAPFDERVRHVIEEKNRVRHAVAALRRRNLAMLAQLLDQRHASLRELYEVSVPEVEATVERLKGAAPPAHGSSRRLRRLGPCPLLAWSDPPDDALTVTPGPAAHALGADVRTSARARR